VLERVKGQLRTLGLSGLVRRARNRLTGGTAAAQPGARPGAPAGGRPRDRIVVSLAPDEPPAGSVLLSYIIDPFLLGPDEPLPSRHTHYWESWQIARTFLDLGYAVDVISWRNTEFVLRKDYAFFVDVRHNLERIAPLLNPDCVKIFHSDTAHMLFQNAAESRRLLELQQRRGVTLQPRRFEMPNLAIEHADCAIIKGNEFTLGTYRYAGKPLYPIWGTPVAHYPWPEDKDFDACRRNFLFLSSGGMVHKGLDLVLEVFAALPDYHLTVCGPVDREKGFEDAFRRELYETPNIHTHGWVDVDGPEFTDIARRCAGLVYPSCSEGQSGGVITCLHAGLIPIISVESGVDVRDDFGVLLKTSSLPEIRAAVERVAALPAETLRSMARSSWEVARAGYTREMFAANFKAAVCSIMAARGQSSGRCANG